jgi:hypothetical protein
MTSAQAQVRALVDGVRSAIDAFEADSLTVERLSWEVKSRVAALEDCAEPEEVAELRAARNEVEVVSAFYLASGRLRLTDEERAEAITAVENIRAALEHVDRAHDASPSLGGTCGKGLTISRSSRSPCRGVPRRARCRRRLDRCHRVRPRQTDPESGYVTGPTAGVPCIPRCHRRSCTSGQAAEVQRRSHRDSLSASRPGCLRELRQPPTRGWVALRR